MSRFGTSTFDFLGILSSKRDFFSSFSTSDFLSYIGTSNTHTVSKQMNSEKQLLDYIDIREQNHSILDTNPHAGAFKHSLPIGITAQTVPLVVSSLHPVCLCN